MTARNSRAEAEKTCFWRVFSDSRLKMPEFVLSFMDIFLYTNQIQQLWRTTMGRQYNKHEKQARRKQYLKRVKLRVKEAIKAAKKK